MIIPIIEERLPANLRIGAAYYDEIASEQAIDPNTGRTYSRLRHSSPKRILNAFYTGATIEIWAGILDIYYRALNGYKGFRVRFIDDFSTNGETGAPTALDQPLNYIAAGVYQLKKQYGSGGPTRIITKPVAGTVKIAIDGIEQMSGWSVDTTTGRVEFESPPANTAAITGGCQFDIPCAFAEKFDIRQIAAKYRETGEIKLVEIL